MFDTLAVTKELQESGLASAPAEAIVAAFGVIVGNVATKDDFEGFATKDDLRALEERMATKDDLRALEKKIEERMATKDDLRALEERMVTKDYLKDTLQYYATKADLLKVSDDLKTCLIEVQRSQARIALATVMANIAMVSGVFVLAKHLM